MIKSDDWEWSQDTLKAIIARIIDRDNNREGEEKNDFNDGRHLAYYEIIEIIKNDLEVRGYNFEDFMK